MSLSQLGSLCPHAAFRINDAAGETQTAALVIDVRVLGRVFVAAWAMRLFGIALTDNAARGLHLPGMTSLVCAGHTDLALPTAVLADYRVLAAEQMSVPTFRF